MSLQDVFEVLGRRGARSTQSGRTAPTPSMPFSSRHSDKLCLAMLSYAKLCLALLRFLFDVS